MKSLKFKIKVNPPEELALKNNFHPERKRFLL